MEIVPLNRGKEKVVPYDENENWCYACGSPISVHKFFCDIQCLGHFHDLFQGEEDKISRAASLITRLRKSKNLPHHITKKEENL